jgi:DNA repair exonuclease SbcCD nuclease subunit
MTEFTFITANDIHISDSGPQGRIDDFKSAMLDKLSQMAMACSKLKADAAIIAGDLYNIKNPAKNTHKLNRELIEVFKTFPCPIYMIEGNHDLTANNIGSLEEQPLGVLFADKTLIQLRHEVIQKGDCKISLVGIPFTEGLEPSTLVLPDKEDYSAQICVMHLFAVLKSGNMFGERLYGYDELVRLPADIFVLGHYHIDQGIYESEGKYFINIGSMSRGTLAEESIDHSPQIGLIKIAVNQGKTEYNIKALKLKVRPAKEVFDLVKKEEQQKQKEEIQIFVDKLATEAVKETVESAKTIDDVIDAMGLVKVIKDRVVHFIQEALAQK